MIIKRGKCESIKVIPESIAPDKDEAVKKSISKVIKETLQKSREKKIAKPE